jgi:hypothetical protein
MRALLVGVMVLAAGAAWADKPAPKIDKPVVKVAAKPAAVVQVGPLKIAAVSLDTPQVSRRLLAQQEAMKTLGFLDGEWRGTVKTLRKTGWTSMVQTERVGAMLDGAVKLIEVRSYEADGRLAFDALRVISYNPEKKIYEMRSYQNGSVRDYELETAANGIAWSVGSNGKTGTRYETVVKNGVWTETATRFPAKGESETYLSVTVKRMRAGTWPEAGALLAK